MACPEKIASALLLVFGLAASPAFAQATAQTGTDGTLSGQSTQPSAPAPETGAAPTSPQPDAQGGGQAAGPGQILRQGIKTQLAHAADAFKNGELTAAVKALDEVHKVIRVAAFANGRKGVFEKAEIELADIKREVQRGQLEEASRRTAALAEEMAKASAANLSTQSPNSDYIGGKLITTEGTLVGEITGQSRDTLEVRVGGYSDVLGFLDFGGTIEQFPVQEIVFGETKTFGATLAVLAREAKPQ